MKSEYRGAQITPGPQQANTEPDLLVPTIALSAHWHMYPERFEWAIAHGFALEYAPNPEAFDLLPVHLNAALAAGVPVRHHGFFPQFDLGHDNVDAAERALRIHKAAVEALHGWGQQVLTVHIGQDREVPISGVRALANLTRLVEHAQGRGTTIALENLRYGVTSDPETVVALARRSGAMITLDVGHAVSCPRVAKGELHPLDFVAMFGERLIEAHVYERESDRHYPPRDMTVLGPIVDALCATDCAWWTIELNPLDEALATRTLLLDYLRAKRAALPRG